MSSSEEKSVKFSPDEFADFIIAKLRERGEERPLIYDKSSFAVVQQDGSGHPEQVFGLSNLFEEYTLADMQVRERILDRYVNFFSGRVKSVVPDTFKEAAKDLLPVVRDRFQYQAINIRFSLDFSGELQSDNPLENDLGVCYKPIGESFAVGLGFDLPESMIQITSRQLKDWGVSFETALEAAMANLAERSQLDFIEAIDGVFVSPFHDSYDLSRILLHDLIRKVPVKGQPVALMPNSESLIITGSDDLSGLSSVLNVIEPLVERPRAMPGIPIVLEHGAWSLYTVSDPDLKERFNVLRISAMSRAYMEQRALLDEWNNKRGKRIAVAPYLAMQRKDGSVSSCSIWPEGVPTLLPVADSVVLTSGSSFTTQDLVACASFGKVLDVSGPRLKKTDYYPQLFLTESFPDPIELAKIGMEMSGMK